MTATSEHRALILDENNPDDRARLDNLRADPSIEFLDRRADLLTELAALKGRQAADLSDEPTRWAYYPWRRVVAGILGPRGFAAVRLDRNRNMITTDEQCRLRTLRIGVVGLSVGHIVAHTLAAEGLCAELRLADFDELALSNLNRVPASVLDIGVNKATIAARRIAELDPYLDVVVQTEGLTAANVDGFLAGLDVLVEECDSLDVKAMVRRAARLRRVPVLMASSDRGLVDVERYDLEPDRPLLHGLLRDSDVDALAGLTARDKIPYVLRIIDGPRVSARGIASLVEVGHTLSTWPQLAADVISGAAAIAEAVRRIGLEAPLPSGRVRIDLGAAFGELTDPADSPERTSSRAELEPPPDPATTAEVVARAASLAPSGGNMQPWRIDAHPDAVTVGLAPEYSSTMDVRYRASAVAIGAALYNARVAAAAQQVLGPVDFVEDPGGAVPLRGVIQLGAGTDPALANLYGAVLARATSRHHTRPGSLPDSTVAELTAAAAAEGGRLVLLTDPERIRSAASLIGEADRIRYLTPHLHAEMISELRWPDEEPDGAGIDVRSLELDASAMSSLAILRRSDVMAHLAEWDGGAALGAIGRETVEASTALAVVLTTGTTLTDYARGGAATEAVWIAAHRHDLAVHPVSPVFLYARDDADLTELSPSHAPTLKKLQQAFHALAGVGPQESIALVLRISLASPPSVRSMRRHQVGNRHAHV